MPDWFIDLWDFAKKNDLPNWGALVFTAIFAPAFTWVWNKRKVREVSGLGVRFFPGNISISHGTQTATYDAVDIQFMNHTGSVVYLTGARIKARRATFPVPNAAAANIADGKHHLLFNNGHGIFDVREQTIQTNVTVQTCIGVTAPLPDSFYSYTTPWWRRHSGCAKYLRLEYTVLVGVKRYTVEAVY